MTKLPTQAEIVIIGGGIIGCSLAYHLTKMGRKDVLLLERKKLTSGTTWHAAGLVRAMLYTANLTRLAQYSLKLYPELEQETGQATGLRQCGSISIATNDERWEELRRGASMARAFGVPAEPITPAQAQELWPLMQVDDVVGAIWFPQDGQVNPADTTMALAKGARMGGATILEDIKVTDILTKDGRAVGVRTAEGDVAAQIVVNCAGMWANEVGRWAGVEVPLQAAEHFYIVTEPMDDLPKGLPILRNMDAGAYFKEDTGKLLVGGFELNAKPWALDGIPDDFCFDEIAGDMDHFMPVIEGAMRRVPRLGQVGIRKFFNGPESFTPDQRYLMGPAPDLQNFWVAAGFNSIGIQSGGGVGMALAHWITEGHPPFDLWDVDLRRMQPHHNDPDYLRTRTAEALGLTYAMHWPYRQFTTARGIRKTPLHDQLAEAGAVFGEVAGWERANWFADRGQKREYRYSFGRQNWFDNAAAEVRAVREAVGLIDLSTLAKYRVSGPDALATLQHVSAADMDAPLGRSVYTQWLNARGGIEADLTVIREAEDRFLVLTGAAAARRDLCWLRAGVRPDARVTITDVTTDTAVLGLMGPLSRTVLETLSSDDFSNAGFPFATSRIVKIAGIGVRATRISYVGELGWELHVPAPEAPWLFATLRMAGANFGLRLVGMHAVDCLRIEKGYRHWGHDLTEEDTPIEAGLGFAVAYDKPGGFLGRDALLAQKARGTPTKRLVQFILRDPGVLLYHNEPIYRDGVRVGLTSSAAYGHHLGGAVALGYVTAPEGLNQDAITASTWEIEVGLQRHAATGSLKPLYDPSGARLKM